MKSEILLTEIEAQLEHIRTNEIRKYLKKYDTEGSELIEKCTKTFLQRIIAFAAENAASRNDDKIQVGYLQQMHHIFNNQLTHSSSLDD